jgi:hypothetical protein
MDEWAMVAGFAAWCSLSRDLPRSSEGGGVAERAHGDEIKPIGA